MKSKSHLPAALAFLLFVGSVPAMAAACRTDLLGDQAPASAAMRTITINPDTKYVNVKADEVVQFVANGKAVTWSFNNPNVWEMKLAKIMPAGAIDHKVMVYVGRNTINNDAD